MTPNERRAHRANRLTPTLLRVCEECADAIIAQQRLFGEMQRDPSPENTQQYLTAAANHGVAEKRVHEIVRIIGCERRGVGRARTKAELAKWDAQQHEKMTSRAWL